MCRIAVLLACLVVATAAPNFIVVVVDDLGYADLGSRDPLFHTPIIDRLMDSGVTFSKFYTSPTCTPSRAQLMTGKYNFKTGMQDSVIHSTEPRGVPLSHKFLSSTLKEAGYATAAIGKWHLGMHMPQYLPLSRGFDHFYGIYTGGGDHYTHVSVSQSFPTRFHEVSSIYSGVNLWEDASPSSDNFLNIHSTNLYKNKTLSILSEFIHTSADTPFFVYLAFQAVHDPIAADPGTIKYTTCKDFASLEESDMDTLYDGVDISNREKLCGMMVMVDGAMGDVIELLRRKGKYDDTVIIFMSDNGGKMAHGSTNYPFRGEKGNYWEGGVHVPAFMSGGYVEEALAEKRSNSATSLQFDGLVHITDVYATIASIAGVQTPDDLDGIDQWSAIQAMDGQYPRSEVVLNLNSEAWGGSGALIMDEYKLIMNPNPKEAVIYNKVREKMSSIALLPDEELLRLVQNTVDSVLSPEKADFYLFNLDTNPSENDEGGCDSVAECHNLWDREAFSHVQEKMVERMLELRNEMSVSTFAWQDDGPLANPINFGGVWGPWRDENGDPYALYSGLSGGAKSADSFSLEAVHSRSRTWSSLSDASALASVAAVSLGLVASVYLAYQRGRREGYERLRML